MSEEIGRLPEADRILVYGVTGSGKSTAAQRIGEVTGLPVTLVDELTWLPGWVPVDADAQLEMIDDITAGVGWVLDSSYGAWLDVVLPRVQLVVGLDYPRWFSLQRLVRRTVHGIVTGTPRCNGNTESLRNALSRDSIVRWHFSSFSRKRARMREWAASPDAPDTLLFSSAAQLEAWLDSLRTARRHATMVDMLGESIAFSGISVDDLDAARTFYRHTLGLVVLDQDGMLFLELAGGHRVLVYPKPDHRPASFTVLNFPVPDVESAVAQLTERGVHFETYEGTPLATDASGVFRGGGPPIAWFTDPAGNVLSVIED